MSKQWAIGLVVQQPGSVRHTAFVVAADDQYEAIGKGHEIARKIYPPSNGFFGYDIVAAPGEIVVTADSAIIAMEP